MHLSRRAFPLVLASPLLAAHRTRIAVSTYSYWHFRGPKPDIEKLLPNAAEIGFDGVELLHRGMESEEPAYIAKIKRLAASYGMSLPMLSIHQDFVSPDPAERQKNIDHTVHCMRLAAALGIPYVRLNSGRWKTIKSFDDLMKVKGDEPPLPGYVEKDAIDWCVGSIEKCLPEAEKLGVSLCLENHWGLTTKVETLLAIWKRVNSPWLGLNVDTGNYPGDPYIGLAALASNATIVQAKTYYGGGEWYTLDLDYPRMAGILKKANFKGWVSLEMEGKEDPATAVPKSYDVLRKAFS
ncbi:MAG: sugar phosphate isomerase/epimerase [Acidobacteria bacterium]|nr:sugar phosphate isomerase/epimerase [Acidobacteriota bacterium]